MFSNLRTEGGITNHVFIPATFHLTNYQEDLVEILSTDNKLFQEFINQNQLITFFEFHRMASEAKGSFFVEYKRKDKIDTLVVKNGLSNHLDITKPMGLLAYKFIRFRPVDKGPCSCKH